MYPKWIKSKKLCQYVVNAFYLVFVTWSLTACRTVNYEPIPGVDEKINTLGKRIAEYQRSEVWTGGNEYSGCYTWKHHDQFHAKGGAQKMAQQARKETVFKEGVIALKPLPPAQQQEILAKWSQPIDPTWAQTGVIGKGTTDAGQKIEREIAEALAALITTMLTLPDQEILGSGQ